jgi:hypothetical protein
VRNAQPYAPLGLLGLLLAGCTAEGSDIGPSIEPLPGKSIEFLVQDDAGRLVANAGVTVSSPGVSAFGARTVQRGVADLAIAGSADAVVRIDPAAAAAQNQDSLIGYALAMDLSDGLAREALHVADLQPSVGRPLDAATPVLAGPVILDDSTRPSTATLRAAGGTTVSGLVGTNVLRSGRISPTNLPGLFPNPGGSALIPGVGVHLGPDGLTFSPAMDLEVADETTSCVQTRRVHYVDGDGIRLRMDLAREYRLDGVSLWALGFDDAAVWDQVLPTVADPFAPTTDG